VLQEVPVGEVTVSRESNAMEEASLPRVNMNLAPQLPPRMKQEPKKDPDTHWEMYVFRAWYTILV